MGLIKPGLETLSLKDKIVETTSSKLIKHFRGLEDAGIIDKETTANLIGCVKKLTAIARGEEPEGSPNVPMATDVPQVNS